MNKKILTASLVLASFCFIGCESGVSANGGQSQINSSVKIGDQVWMKENLNVTAEKSWCYDDDLANCEKYGHLYSWESAKKACPTGWHLPSKEDFERLLLYIGSNDDERGAYLRARSWNDGLDKFGFSAIPSGIYSDDGWDFDDIGSKAYFWSSTREYDRGEGYYEYPTCLKIFEDGIDLESCAEIVGASVRCLKDN